MEDRKEETYEPENDYVKRFGRPVDDRIIGCELKPKQSDEAGSLNDNFNQMRAIGDYYTLEPKHANYILQFRKQYTPKEMLTPEYLLTQSYFQPPSALLTEEYVKRLQKGIVEFGVHPDNRSKMFQKHIQKTYSPRHFDIMVHIALAVVDITPYYYYNFKNQKEVATIRKNNLKKAKEQNRVWGNLYWNIDYPPMPKHYPDENGDFTLLKPTWRDVNVKVLGELQKLKWPVGKLLPKPKNTKNNRRNR